MLTRNTTIFFLKLFLLQIYGSRTSIQVSYTIFDTFIANSMEIQINLSMLSTAPKLKNVCYETFPVLESRDNLHGNTYGRQLVPITISTILRSILENGPNCKSIKSINFYAWKYIPVTNALSLKTQSYFQAFFLSPVEQSPLLWDCHWWLQMSTFEIAKHPDFGSIQSSLDSKPLWSCLFKQIILNICKLISSLCCAN